ncbi:MAG TPA: right-handed parallel beta-helix repeat-containing protein [Planctomycetota bacterium]
MLLERAGQRIERSSRLQAPAGVLADAGEGVLVIAGNGITVELAGELRGSPADAAADTFAGVGIRVTGKDVTLRGARVAGYKVAIHAVEADGLVLEDCDVSGNFRQRLLSTKEKEANEDWLDPHHNDAREWFSRYGAGIYVERADRVTVRRSRARAGQNGLVLDRCTRAVIEDNDFSFLSGWGIALWRSSQNRILGNRCDFCIRGYVHGVYNRGQDSAGILLFEQCSHNVIAFNSASYCGDGFFGFAGQEALGGVPPPNAEFDYRQRGNNDNWIAFNDFSFAAAHGLELTFSFGNRIVTNRMEGNAICGIWGGYSRDTWISGNVLRANGDAGYGLERGGINIEHGQRNRIVENEFERNACGVHLWWDADEHLAQLPWTRANGHESRENCVQANRFQDDELALHLRDTPGTLVHGNEVRSRKELECTTDSHPEDRACPATGPDIPAFLLESGRSMLLLQDVPGREAIEMGEWGPVEKDVQACRISRP